MHAAGSQTHLYPDDFDEVNPTGHNSQGGYRVTQFVTELNPWVLSHPHSDSKTYLANAESAAADVQTPEVVALAHPQRLSGPAR